MAGWVGGVYPSGYEHLLEQRSAHLLFKKSESKYFFGLAGCPVSVAAPHLGQCSMKAVADSVHKNARSCVPVKLYF